MALFLPGEVIPCVCTLVVAALPRLFSLLLPAQSHLYIVATCEAAAIELYLFLSRQRAIYFLHNALESLTGC
jgi:hypothetical protein